MGGASSGKKQREVYVGNLTIGAVTDAMLRELFNGALSHLMPNPELNPPVVNVGMDPSGGPPVPLLGPHPLDMHRGVLGSALGHWISSVQLVGKDPALLSPCLPQCAGEAHQCGPCMPAKPSN